MTLRHVVVQAKGDVNAHNLRKNTALHFAFEQSHMKLAQFLLDEGAKMSKNSLGKTPRMLNPKMYKKLRYSATVCWVMLSCLLTVVLHNLTGNRSCTMKR